MIGYVNGEVINIEGNTVLMLNNGIGYEIACSSSALASLMEKGGGAVYTYMAVKEDGVSLYGFISLEEKSMFLKLITVSGVGAKMGITILSEMKLSDLAVAIAQNDVKRLSAVKGIGKKTAERIILELREKVTAEEVSISAKIETVSTQTDEEAVVALMSLGFTKAESVKAILFAKEKGASKLEEIISLALRNIR